MQFPLGRTLSPLGRSLAVAGGGGGGFIPTDIAGLGLWLKADSLALADGDPISTWTDSSGAGHDATAIGVGRAHYKTAILNGLPVVRFESSLPPRMQSTLSRTQPYTVFIVVRETDNVANQYLIDGGAALNSGVLAFIGSAASFANQVTMFCGAALSGSLTPTNWNQITAIYNTSASSLYVAGSLVGSGNVGGSSTGGTNIGCAGDATSALDGDIAEILIYDSALSSLDRGDVEQYLSDKYNL